MAEKEEQINGCHLKPVAEASKQTENVAETEQKTMTPWEQHSAVISIPRFDYNAPSALLHRCQSGFLITCTIKREKSATKEAISILEKYIQYFISSMPETLVISDENETSKRRKVCTEDVGHKSVEGQTSTDEHVKGTCLISTKSEAKVEKCSPISLVKLTRSGLLLFTFTKDISPDTVYIVKDIIQCLEVGTLKSPAWCHRIFPIQATCCLNENDLRAVVSKLVLHFMKEKGNVLSHPVKFAVGYNRRGIEETEMKKTSKDSSGANVILGRDKCFSIVAASVKDVVSDAIVDLKSPELCILVELLPVSGLPLESLVVGVSVLPNNLVTTKPRLCIKALTSDTKAKS